MSMKPKTRRYIPFEARRPRERSSCPKCESVDVKKRVRTHDYVCNACGWEGDAIRKVMR
jgi:ribosomal protein L37AE/L43A